MQVIYIYCVINLVNGKKYVGQSRYLPEVRFRGHCSDANTRPNRRGLARAIRKYGKSSFLVEQLCSVESQNEANDFERKMISKFDCISNGYNMLSGGAGARTVGNPHVKTKEWKEIMSRIRKNLWNDPVCRQKMISGRWKDRPKRTRYLPSKLSKSERASIISESNKKRAKTYSFISPDNDLFVITNINNFCKDRNLNPTCMCRVANGSYGHHKRWTKAPSGLERAGDAKISHEQTRREVQV